MLIDVELIGVSKFFGSVKAVNNLSLKVEKGRFVTLLGPSGCGKTTTLRLIAGLEQPDAGAIHIKNEDVSHLPPYKRDIGMVFQDYALFPHMTVFNNIAFGLKMKKTPKSEIKRMVNKALELVRLGGFEERYPREMSGGQRQRVALARALVIEPSVLLLDEPLSNLDAKLREEMRVELKQIQQDLGLTTIFVTHDQIEALVMSDEIVVMNEGKIEAIGTPYDVYRTPPNKFTSEFIGRANFFEGKVSPNNEGIFTDDGLLLPIDVKELEDCEEISIAIRPEKIKIVKRTMNPSVNVLDGYIKFISYIGSSIQYQVQLKSGKVILVEEQNVTGRPRYNIGEPVSVEFKVEDFLVFRKGVLHNSGLSGSNKQSD